VFLRANNGRPDAAVNGAYGLAHGLAIRQKNCNPYTIRKPAARSIVDTRAAFGARGILPTTREANMK
jgi:hypothetical protein